MPTRHSRAVRAFLLGLLLADVMLTASPASAATATPFNTNLVKNPGGEQGAGTNGYSQVDIPHWVSENSSFTVVRYGAPGFPKMAESQRIHGGKKFFACGDAVSLGHRKQRITLVGRTTLVNNGHIRAILSARIASYDGQQDSGFVQMSFRDASDVEIDYAVAGPV